MPGSGSDEAASEAVTAAPHTEADDRAASPETVAQAPHTAVEGGAASSEEVAAVTHAEASGTATNTTVEVKPNAPSAAELRAAAAAEAGVAQEMAQLRSTAADLLFDACRLGQVELVGRILAIQGAQLLPGASSADQASPVS